MPTSQKKTLKLKFQPLTPERWADLEELFGSKGAYGGCWCMWWRVTRSKFTEQQSEGNRRAMKKIVSAGEIAGLLAYADGKPVGWCSVAPREAFPALDRSPVLKRIDDEPVWSIVCFYVARGHRRQGVTTGLLGAAVEYARKHGAKIVEGYPLEPRKGSMPDPYAYMGLPSAFRKAGFVEVARRSDVHPIMRYTIGRKARGKG